MDCGVTGGGGFEMRGDWSGMLYSQRYRYVHETCLVHYLVHYLVHVEVHEPRVILYKHQTRVSDVHLIMRMLMTRYKLQVCQSRKIAQIVIETEAPRE